MDDDAIEFVKVTATAASTSSRVVTVQAAGVGAEGDDDGAQGADHENQHACHLFVIDPAFFIHLAHPPVAEPDQCQIDHGIPPGRHVETSAPARVARRRKMPSSSDLEIIRRNCVDEAGRKSR